MPHPNEDKLVNIRPGDKLKVIVGNYPWKGTIVTFKEWGCITDYLLIEEGEEDMMYHVSNFKRM